MTAAAASRWAKCAATATSRHEIIGKYHHRDEATDADRVDRGIHPEDEAVLREGIRLYFPDADGPTLAHR